MTTDELEFQISQYLDGTLPPADVAALQQRIATDPEAAALLGEYQKLQNHLMTTMPLPAIAWDRLASQLSDAMSEADGHTIAGRIGWRWQRRFTVAAGVLIVIGAGVLLSVRSHSSDPVVAARAVTVIEGPAAEAAAGPVIEQIAVGPSPSLAARENSWRYAEGVVTRPSHIELAGAIQPAPGVDSHIH